MNGCLAKEPTFSLAVVSLGKVLLPNMMVTPSKGSREACRTVLVLIKHIYTLKGDLD